MRTVVTDVNERERYEVRVDGELAAFTAYKTRRGIIAFIHTEVEEGFRRRGLGDRLIAYALDDARKRELAVLPFCPFVQSFIQAHRDYADSRPAEPERGVRALKR